MNGRASSAGELAARRLATAAQAKRQRQPRDCRPATSCQGFSSAQQDLRRGVRLTDYTNFGASSSGVALSRTKCTTDIAGRSALLLTSLGAEIDCKADMLCQVSVHLRERIQLLPESSWLQMRLDISITSTADTTKLSTIWQLTIVVCMSHPELHTGCSWRHSCCTHS